MAGGSSNLALYERAADDLPFNPRFHAPLTHPGLALPLQRKAAGLGYSLL